LRHAPKSGASVAWMRSAMPAWATPWVTTKRPAKKSSNVPSTWAAERNHGDGSRDRAAGAIQLEERKLGTRQEEVRRDEDDQRGEHFA
jgi:hypothetical protein